MRAQRTHLLVSLSLSIGLHGLATAALSSWRRPSRAGPESLAARAEATPPAPAELERKRRPRIRVGLAGTSQRSSRADGLPGLPSLASPSSAGGASSADAAPIATSLFVPSQPQAVTPRPAEETRAAKGVQDGTGSDEVAKGEKVGSGSENIAAGTAKGVGTGTGTGVHAEIGSNDVAAGAAKGVQAGSASNDVTAASRVPELQHAAARSAAASGYAPRSPPASRRVELPPAALARLPLPLNEEVAAPDPATHEAPRLAAFSDTGSGEGARALVQDRRGGEEGEAGFASTQGHGEEAARLARGVFLAKLRPARAAEPGARDAEGRQDREGALEGIQEGVRHALDRPAERATHEEAKPALVHASLVREGTALKSPRLGESQAPRRPSAEDARDVEGARVGARIDPTPAGPTAANGRAAAQTRMARTDDTAAPRSADDAPANPDSPTQVGSAPASPRHVGDAPEDPAAPTAGTSSAHAKVALSEKGAEGANGVSSDDSGARAGQSDRVGTDAASSKTSDVGTEARATDRTLRGAQLPSPNAELRQAAPVMGARAPNAGDATTVGDAEACSRRVEQGATPNLQPEPGHETSEAGAQVAPLGPQPERGHESAVPERHPELRPPAPEAGASTEAPTLLALAATASSPRAGQRDNTATLERHAVDPITGLPGDADAAEQPLPMGRTSSPDDGAATDGSARKLIDLLMRAQAALAKAREGGPGAADALADAAQALEEVEQLEWLASHAARHLAIGTGAGAGAPGAGEIGAGDSVLPLVQQRVSETASLVGGSVARRLNRSGEATVRFRVDERGYVQGLEILSSTGVREFDEELAAILHLAEPFPEARSKWVRVKVPFKAPGPSF